MRKLSDVKLRQIRVWRDADSIYRLAKKMKFSSRQMRRILTDFDNLGFNMLTRKPGRKQTIISEEEIKLVKKFYLIYKSSATILEEIIFNKTSIHIPHNRIHKILKKEKFTMFEETKKRKRKKWVRYEREEPNELWHTDWCEIEYRGRIMQFIAFLDDYSRFIVGYGMFSNATCENSIFVLRDAINLYGKPKAVMSDKGTQFYVPDKEGFVCSKNQFQKFLDEKGIIQITARVKHPQSNGKIERFFLTLRQKLPMFSDIHEFVHWYNHIKPHMSLELNPPSYRFLNRN